MLQSRTILVVEDDDDTREAVVKVLRAEGHLVFAATDGVDAWAALSSMGFPDLILLDIMMPRLDGETFLRMRARTPELAAIPVIVMTAGDKAPPGTCVLKKPLRLPILIGLVERELLGADSAC